MNKDECKATEFYIDDHAVLYGCLAKSAEKRMKLKGLEIVEQAVVLLARERGLRSAKRCIANGDDLNIKNYHLYGELYDEKKWNKLKVQSLSPTYTTNMLVCGWDESWRKYDLIKYGKGYCKWIDKNLLYGYNPKLKLEMDKFLTYDDGCCSFKWIGCDFIDKKELDSFMERRIQLIPTVTKSYLYHCGHLLSAIARIFYFHFGLLTTDEILKEGVKDYADIFGKEKAKLIYLEAKEKFIYS